MESEISTEDAGRMHGITTRHGRLTPGHELRFRLLKDDGTAYIRTEAPPQGAWQQAHYHLKVFETYIVQRGWVGYAEEVSGIAFFRRYEAGERFTTRPNVIHNLYLPAGAVIHTVKHGNGAGERRLVGFRSEKFTRMTAALTEPELLARCASSPVPATTVFIADDDTYRHFDNLVWQGSAWSSGLFTLALAGLTQIQAGSPIIAAIGMGYASVLAGFSAMFCGFILVISHGLYRFRWHQRAGRPLPAPRSHWRSPQVGLQLMVNIQAGVLGAISLLLLGASRPWTLVLVCAATLALQGYQEGKIARWLGTARDTRS